MKFFLILSFIFSSFALANCPGSYRIGTDASDLSFSARRFATTLNYSRRLEYLSNEALRLSRISQRLEQSAFRRDNCHRLFNQFSRLRQTLRNLRADIRSYRRVGRNVNIDFNRVESDFRKLSSSVRSSRNRLRNRPVRRRGPVTRPNPRRRRPTTRPGRATRRPTPTPPRRGTRLTQDHTII